MLGTRIDICFAVNYFSRFQDKGTDEACNHLKRILRYLKMTMSIGSEYKRNYNNEICCFVDSNWGGDTLDRKSVTGYVFKLFGNTLCWTTKKQTSVALSTTEAELVALCASVSEDLWLKKLFLDLRVVFDLVTFYEDNQGCLALIKNPANNRRVEHLDLKFHFVSENVKNGKIEVIYVDSSINKLTF